MAQSIDTQIIQIGNSKGVRLPKSMVQAIGSYEIHMEEQNGIITIRAKRKRPAWSEWDAIMEKRAAEGITTDPEDDNLISGIAGETLKEEPPYDWGEAHASK